MNENAAPPAEVPPAPAVQTENQTPPASVPAPPPAAALVLSGVKSEREIQLERDLESEKEARRKAEFLASEKEREVQNLRAIPAPPKVKRARGWTDPVFE